MGVVMKVSEFVPKLIDIAKNYKTLYVMGCFGAPMTARNKTRYLNNHDYNRKAARSTMIKNASADTFGFDCVNLIKGVLWGWSGSKSKVYGGATYKSNGVAEVNADGMIKLCSGVSTNFAKIEIGEIVWCKGHVGVYIGDGLAVECTPAWKNKVQITAVRNIGAKSGYNARTWTKHGKLPYLEYDVVEKSENEEACEVELKVLKKGAKGDEVKALQTLLIGYGFSCGSAGVDGSFGNGTLKAVKAYQKAAGLTVDGSVGKKTWSKLLGID